MIFSPRMDEVEMVVVVGSRDGGGLDGFFGAGNNVDVALLASWFCWMPSPLCDVL